MEKRFDLNREVNAVIEEIMTYKWLESEKNGSDIGIDRAASEWINSYYDNWFKYNAEKFLMLNS